MNIATIAECKHTIHPQHFRLPENRIISRPEYYNKSGIPKIV